MSDKRLKYADMMKGIAILFIVIYHLIAPCTLKTIITHIMPASLIIFFFYAGFFYKPNTKTFGERLKARAKALLVPFFKFSLIFWLVGSVVLVIKKEETIQEALYCLRNFFIGSIWNRSIQDFFGWEYYSLGKRYFFLADFWFLIALMLASILFFIIADFVLKSKAKSLITAVLLFAVTGVLRGFAISLPYNLQLIPFWTGFLLLGAFTHQYNLFDHPKLKGRREIVIAIVCIVCGALICAFHKPDVNMFRGTFNKIEVVSMILTTVSSLLLIYGVSVLFKRIEVAGVRVKELSWLGTHSLTFYLYHMFIAWIICQITGFSVIYKEPIEPKTVVYSFIVLAVCMIVCILRAVIADKISKKIAERKGT